VRGGGPSIKVLTVTAFFAVGIHAIGGILVMAMERDT
jgi:hypothetical protein